jgi:uncharacterized membrane protein (UPF0127 family)
VTQRRLSDHAETAVYHESQMSRAVGIIPYQPITNTAHIFTFPTKAKHGFHAIFVFQPLTLIFLDDNTVIDTHTLHPFTTYTPKKQCDTVIELNDDTDIQSHVKPGDVIKNDL